MPLLYHIQKRQFVDSILTGEGARLNGGRWNPIGTPLLYTSTTPELALLEIIAHLNPTFVPSFHLLVLEVPDPTLTISLTQLPLNWRDDDQYEPLQIPLLDWLTQPNGLCVAVPSSIVPRSTKYLLHRLHAGFNDQVRIVGDEAFDIDSRLYGAL